MRNDKYREYKKFISEGINITEGFDLTSITYDNYIMHKILSSDVSKAQNNILHFYLSFAFVHDNSYCLIILLDKTPRGEFPFFDYWYADIDEKGNSDIIEYIHNAKRFWVYKFDLQWYYDKVESKYICDKEKNMMFPVIRRLKIQNLLK